MKFTKALALLMCAVMLISAVGMFAVTTSAEKLAQLDGQYTVEDGTLTLKLKLQNNPGINTLVFDLGYDSSALTLLSYTNGDVFSEANNGSLFNVNTANNPLVFYFEEKGIENITANGTVLVINFMVVKETEDYGFTLVVDEENTFGSGEGIVPVDVPFGTPTITEGPDVVPGDINGDGKINAVDTNLMKKILTNGITPTPEQFAAADINGDGKINAVDSNLLKRLILGGQ